MPHPGVGRGALGEVMISSIARAMYSGVESSDGMDRCSIPESFLPFLISYLLN